MQLPVLVLCRSGRGRSSIAVGVSNSRVGVVPGYLPAVEYVSIEMVDGLERSIVELMGPA